MGAETRLAVVLFGSFVLWIPALGSVLRGELDAGVAGMRWGIGAVLVWAMVAVLNQLITGYAVAPTEEAAARRATDQRGARRRSDRPETDRQADRASDEEDHVEDSGGDVTTEDRAEAVDVADELVGDAAAMETV